MIFASVGSMLPFERFVRAVDEWGRDHPGETVYLQIGDTVYEPRFVPFARMMSMQEYRERLSACDLFVAHAGMGSILQALEECKQTLMLPRHREWGEHTTDHQMHTAARFGHVPGLQFVDSVEDLQRHISELLKSPIIIDKAISNEASPRLLSAVQGFLSGVRTPS